MRLLLLLAVLPLAAQSILTVPLVYVPVGITDVSLDLVHQPTGTAPAAIQWDLSVPPGAALVVTRGPAAVAAAKSLACNLRGDVSTCIVSGVNTNLLAEGVVATLAFHLPAIAAITPITLSRMLGASLAGGALIVTAQPASIRVGFPRPHISR